MLFDSKILVLYFDRQLVNVKSSFTQTVGYNQAILYVKRGLNKSAKNIDPDQPAVHTQPDLEQKPFALGHSSACQRAFLTGYSVSCKTKWSF